MPSSKLGAPSDICPVDSSAKIANCSAIERFEDVGLGQLLVVGHWLIPFTSLPWKVCHPARAGSPQMVKREPFIEQPFIL
jgi:hypothetical protein